MLDITKMIVEVAREAIAAYKEKPLEAPASINIKFRDHNGNDVMLTVRDNDPKKLWGKYLQFSDLIASKRKKAEPRPKKEKAAPGSEVVSIGSDSPIEREKEMTIDQKPAPDLSGGQNLTFEIECLQGLKRGENVFWYAWGGAPFDKGLKCPIPSPIFSEALTNQTISELMDISLEKDHVYQITGLIGEYIYDETEHPQMVMIRGEKEN